MRRDAYSPNGYRPEPTEAPQTPPPISPPARPDAFKDMRERIERVSAFLVARMDEEDGPGTGRVQRAMGYALGYAEHCIESGDIVGAVRQLTFLRTEAAHWNKHADYHQAVQEPGR